MVNAILALAYLILPAGARFHAVPNTAYFSAFRVGGLFPMAAQTKRALIGYEHLLVDGPMRLMADLAVFPHRFMFKNVRPFELLVAFEACFVRTLK